MNTLVLLPGLDGTGRLFAPLVAALDWRAPPLVVDYPPHEPGDYATATRRAQTALPQTQPFVILGESFSGPVAIELAARRPPGLRGVILVCAFARSPRPAWVVLKPWLRWLPLHTAWHGVMGSLLMGAGKTPRLQQLLTEALAEVPAATLRARLAATLSVDVSDRLQAIDVPVLYLQATHDLLVPDRCGQEIQQRCAHAELVRLAGPHGLLQTQAQAAAKTIQRFVHDV